MWPARQHLQRLARAPVPHLIRYARGMHVEFGVVIDQFDKQ